MTAHTHTVITPGCYRCDLNADEVLAAEQEQAEQMAREVACPEHDWMQRGTAGNWWRECWLCGADQDVA